MYTSGIITVSNRLVSPFAKVNNSFLLDCWADPLSPLILLTGWQVFSHTPQQSKDSRLRKYWTQKRILQVIYFFTYYTIKLKEHNLKETILDTYDENSNYIFVYLKWLLKCDDCM